MDRIEEIKAKIEEFEKELGKEIDKRFEMYVGKYFKIESENVFGYIFDRFSYGVKAKTIEVDYNKLDICSYEENMLMDDIEKMEFITKEQLIDEILSMYRSKVLDTLEGFKR